MQPRTIKRIFIFFMIYLPIQYALVGVIGLYDSEPWPAFVFPGFKSVFATEGDVKIDEARLFAITDNDQQNRTEVAPSHLFEGLPASQLQGFLRSNFNQQKEFSDNAKKWFRDQLKRLYPEQSFSKLLIEWSVVTYRQEDSTVSLIDRESTETFTILLDME